MSVNHIAKVSKTINRPAVKVWEALTTPALIKEYLFGTEAVSDWNTGSSIEFRGEWNGNAYSDKGTILRSEPCKIFQYNFWSSLSGLEDLPENYMNISYELQEEDGKTLLTIRQENISDEKTKDHSEKNWAMVLERLKEVVEHQDLAHHQ